MTKLSKEEVWLPIPGCPNYEASSFGRIRNIARRRILTPTRNPVSGYYQIGLGRGNYGCLHTYICLAFRGPRPSGFDCAHRNGDKNDNSSSNLLWVTKKENMAHAREHGTLAIGAKNAMAKLSEADIHWIRSSYSGTLGQAAAMARKFGVAPTTISKILLNKRWRHVQAQ